MFQQKHRTQWEIVLLYWSFIFTPETRRKIVPLDQHTHRRGKQELSVVQYDINANTLKKVYTREEKKSVTGFLYKLGQIIAKFNISDLLR